MLHGEIVAVGMLMQLKFNEMDASYISDVRALMEHMQLPVTLRQLGITPSAENLNILMDYLIPATALTQDDRPRLQMALDLIA